MGAGIQHHCGGHCILADQKDESLDSPEMAAIIDVFPSAQPRQVWHSFWADDRGDLRQYLRIML
jgi:hypothetical protein